jgi:hypothetical protein
MEIKWADMSKLNRSRVLGVLCVVEVVGVVGVVDVVCGG